MSAAAPTPAAAPAAPTAFDTALVGRTPGLTRIALLAGGAVWELHLFRDHDLDPGTLLLGRVRAHLPSAAAAFIALPHGPDGFLPREDCPGRRLPPVGAAVAVRVTQAARAEKGPKLSARLPPPATPPAPSPSAAPALPAPALLAPPAEPLAAALAGRPVAEVRRGGGLSADPFATAGGDDALAEALSPVVPLPGGGRLWFAETPACATIDVDAGAADPAALVPAAARLVARHIRLRGLGGVIVLDPALPPRRPQAVRQAWAEALVALLAADPVPTRVAGISPAGLVELVRERRRPPLSALAHGPEAQALDALRALLAAACHHPRTVPRLELPAAAAAALRGPLAAALAEAGRLLGQPVTVTSPGGPP